MKSAIPASLLGSALLTASLSAQAASCPTYAGFTTLEGDTVCFLYDPDDVSPLYGTLSVSGNNIFSTPDGFIALSTGGGETVTEGVGTVRVVAKDGFELQAVNVGERGNYVLNGAGSSVDVDAVLDVFDWNSPVFGSYESKTLSVTGDLGIQDGDPHLWSASTSFDMTIPLWDSINDVGLTLTNILTATTNTTGETATITKTLAGTELISIETTPIPVPAAVWLFGSGLLGLVGVARRRKAA